MNFSITELVEDLSENQIHSDEILNDSQVKDHQDKVLQFINKKKLSFCSCMLLIKCNFYRFQTLQTVHLKFFKMILIVIKLV